jgi:hypothetical protein
MSLKDEFGPDYHAVFANPDEFGDLLMFEIKENGVPKILRIECVWDNDTLKQRPIVSQQGVFLGSVLWIVAKEYFKVRPRPEEVIYKLSDRSNYKEPWIVLDVSDVEDVYEIYLDHISA